MNSRILFICTRCYAELLLEAAREVAQRGEAGLVGDLRHGVAVFLDELRGTVELVGLYVDNRNSCRDPVFSYR